MPRSSNTYAADGSIVIGTSVDMYGMNTGLKKIQKSMKKLAVLTGGVLGIGAFVKFGKAALNAASDLQEVQNIVDVSFGKMSGAVDTFAKNAITKFGMSELAAKQTAGSFMAMGKALGIAEEDAAKMAIQLTALTGDMSSFYNISQDYARVALSAVYTGETETLKRYGIVLTEANLQEYASTLGITTKVKAMDASTKAMLRYQYILKATTDIEGDFVRTQATWANQVRVLQQRWNEFLITIGSGLITVLTPVLQFLNVLLQRLIVFADTLGKILSKIFGIKWQDITEEMGALSDEEADVSDSLDDAGDAAEKAGKKVKKTLAPWDELTDLMKTTADAGDDVKLSFELPDMEDLVGQLKGADFDFDFPDIMHLFSLGRKIGEMIADMLENIDWASIRDKFNRVGEQIADFLNGIINPETFGELGKTLAEGLNSLVEIVNGFSTRFNWENLGRSVAAGINDFFKNFDFKLLADTINKWVLGVLEAFITGVENVDWKLVGKKIGLFLSEIDWGKMLQKGIEAIYDTLSGITEMWQSAFNNAPIEILIASLVVLKKLLKLAVVKSFVKGMTSAIKTMNLFGDAIALSDAKFATLTRGLSNSRPVLSSALTGFREFTNTTGSLFTKLSTGFEAFRNSLPLLVKAIGGVATALAEFFVVKNLFHELSDEIKSTDSTVGDLILTIGKIAGAVTIAAGVLIALFGVPAGVIAAAIVGVIALIASLNEDLEAIDAQAIDDAFTNVATNVEGMSHSLDDYLVVFDGFKENITQGLDEVNSSFENLEASRAEVKETTDIIGTIAFAMQTERELTEGEIEQLKSAFDSLNSQLKDSVDVYYDTIIAQTQADYAYLVSIKGYSKELEEEYANRIQSLYEAKADAETKAGEATKEASDALDKYMQVSSDTNSTTEQIVAAQNDLHDACLDLVRSSLDLTNQTSEMDDALTDAKTSFDDLQGSLKLADYGEGKTKDAVAEISSAVSQLGDSYEQAKKTIEDNLDHINKELATATGTEKAELERQKEVAETRLADLNKAYAEGLAGIQKDIVEFVPGMMAELEKQWDEKSDLWKAFHPKSEWLKSEMETWISDLYGDEGLKGTLKEAWQKLGVDAGPDAEESAKTILNKFFDTYKSSSDGKDFQYLKDNWKQFSSGIMDGALEGIDEKADDLVEKANAPFVEAEKKIRETTQVHSPSPLYRGITADMMKGAIEGIEEQTDPFIKAIDKTFEGVEGKFTKVQTVFKPFAEWLNSYIMTPFKDGMTKFDTAIDSSLNKFNSFGTTIESKLKTIASDFSSTFATEIKSVLTNFISEVDNSTSKFTSLWSAASNAVEDIFGGLGISITSAIANTIDDIINTVVAGINNIIDAVNDAIDSILQIGDAIDNLPSIPNYSLSNFRVPRLASGAVIPPNKEFLAMLGDQKRGTNIEAPLDTIKQAFMETLSGINFGGNDNQDIVIQIDGYEVFRAMRNQSELFRNSTGYNGF